MEQTQKEIETKIINDDLGKRIRTATKEVLDELGLSDWVEVRGVDEKGFSFVVGLTKHTGPPAEFCSFFIEAAEVSKSVQFGYVSIEALKPFIRREVSQAFPKID